MRQQSAESKGGLASSDLAVISLLALGGIDRYIDQEDIAVFCYRIAPKQFGWQRHPYPNLEAARVALMHAQHTGGAPWVRRPKKVSREWALTSDGVKHAVRAASVLLGRGFETANDAMDALAKVDDRDSQKAVPRGERRPGRREVTAVEGHPVLAAWVKGKDLGEFEKWELADAIGCLPDSPSWVWQERADRLAALSEQWDAPEVKRFVAEVLRTVGITPGAAASGSGVPLTVKTKSRTQADGRGGN